MPNIEITADELSNLLNNEETTPEILAQYFEEDEDRSEAFNVRMKLRPEVTVTYRPGQVEVEQFGGTVLDGANGFMRWKRNRIYNRRKNDPGVVRLVAEGDSWFQHPLITETIDHLVHNHGRAIRSLDAAGATLEDMIIENEYINAIKHEGARALLLSGGGNDLMGGRFGEYLNDHSPGTPGLNAARFLNAKLDADMQRIFDQYLTILHRVKTETPGVKVFTHTYDYVKPRSGKAGKWLGGPMDKRKIFDPLDRKAIIKLLIDRFHQGVRSVCQSFPGVAIHIRTIGAVPAGDQWWDDEIHPTDGGFQPVANLFQQALQAEGL